MAELHEPGASYSFPESLDPILSEWVEAGIVVPAIRKKVELQVSPVAVEEGAARRLLDEDRADGRR